MSQYNAAPLSAADNVGWNDLDPELAPFLPTTDQSRASNPPVEARTGQSVGIEMTLPPNVEFVSLHAKAEFTGQPRIQPDIGSSCATCFASFPTDHQLERHASKNKHKAYLCTCGKGFTKLSALRRHIQESTQAHDHQCPLCDHKCKRPGHVEQHLRLIHKKPKDVIKKLLSSRNSEPPRQGLKQASAASAAVPATGSMVPQTEQPVVIPGGPWLGPSGFAATAPVDDPGSRPGDSSAFFPASGMAHMFDAPGFAPQNYVMQAPGLPAYAAFSGSDMPAQTGLFAPDVSGYPSAPVDGANDLFNMDLASVSVNPADGFGTPPLETGFMGDLCDFDFNTFGI